MEYTLEHPRLFVATKAFIECQGKVLILREAGSYLEGSNLGKYDVVGGRLEPGQHFAESLRREIREETGLEVEIGNPFFVNEWRPTVKGEPWQIVGIFFACTAATDKVQLSQDHDAFSWIDPTDYEANGIIGNLVTAFEAYVNR